MTEEKSNYILQRLTSNGYVKRTPEEVQSSIIQELKKKNPNFEKMDYDVQANLIDTGVEKILQYENILAAMFNAYSVDGSNNFFFLQMGEELGLRMKKSYNAQVVLRFRGLPGDIIPIHTKVKDSSGHYQFETWERVVLGTTGEVDVVAYGEADSIVPAGKLVHLVTILSDGITVTNPLPSMEKIEAETFEQYKIRAQARLRSPRMGGRLYAESCITSLAGVDPRLVEFHSRNYTREYDPLHPERSVDFYEPSATDEEDIMGPNEEVPQEIINTIKLVNVGEVHPDVVSLQTYCDSKWRLGVDVEEKEFVHLYNKDNPNNYLLYQGNWYQVYFTKPGDASIISGFGINKNIKALEFDALPKETTGGGGGGGNTPGSSTDDIVISANSVDSLKAVIMTYTWWPEDLLLQDVGVNPSVYYILFTDYGTKLSPATYAVTFKMFPSLINIPEFMTSLEAQNEIKTAKANHPDAQYLIIQLSAKKNWSTYGERQCRVNILYDLRKNTYTVPTVLELMTLKEYKAPTPPTPPVIPDTDDIYYVNKPGDKIGFYKNQTLKYQVFFGEKVEVDDSNRPNNKNYISLVGIEAVIGGGDDYEVALALYEAYFETQKLISNPSDNEEERKRVINLGLYNNKIPITFTRPKLLELNLKLSIGLLNKTMSALAIKKASQDYLAKGINSLKVGKPVVMNQLNTFVAPGFSDIDLKPEEIKHLEWQYAIGQFKDQTDPDATDDEKVHWKDFDSDSKIGVIAYDCYCVLVRYEVEVVSS